MRKYIFAFIIVAIIFNGFSNLREITDLAIVKFIGLELTESGEYIVNIVVVDTSDKENINKGILYTSTGASVQEAIRNIVDKSPKRLYLAHMEMLVISEDIAKNNMEKTLDFFIRDDEGSNNFYLLISEDDTPEDIVNILNEEEINMEGLLSSSAKYKGNSNMNTLSDNIKDILRIGKDICVTSCYIEDDQIVIGNMAYFSDWNMQGYLTENESIIFNLLTNNKENAIITSKLGEDVAVAEIIESNTKYEFDKATNSVKLKVEAKANITEVSGNLTISTDEDIDVLEQLIKSKLEDDISQFMHKIQYQYKCDILGIGNLLYRKKSDLYLNENYLADINIDYNVEISILKVGGVY